MALNENNKTNTSSGQNLSPSQLRLLKTVVLVTGVFLIVGFVGLASVLVYKLTATNQTAAVQHLPKSVQTTVRIPEGAIVKSVSGGDQTVSMHITKDGLSEIFVIHAKSGNILNRILVRTESNK